MNFIEISIQSDKKLVAEFLANLNMILNDKEFNIDKNLIIIKSKKEKEKEQFSTPYTLADLEYDASDIVQRLKELTVQEYSETLFDRDDDTRKENIMPTNKFIRKVSMDCPLCDKIHELEERERTATLTIKGEKVSYRERYFFCCNCREEENEFETGSMINANLAAARNAYRSSHHLLTSDEIIKIRESYGLSQVDLAKLLDWGEATVARYESKSIQDEAYDNMLRIIQANPLKAIELLDKNKDKFTDSKRIQIRSNLEEKLDSYGKEFLKRQALEGEYAHFSEPSDSNGYKTLDIDKIECVLSYYAEHMANLYKVKMMKLLWYGDALFFRSAGTSITGLVYRHEAMGALPIGHYSILNLENVNVRTEEGYDYTSYRFFPNPKLSMDCLSTAERKVLDLVIEKFRDFNAPDIVNYMHQERAYLETNPGDIIGYSLAKDLRPF